MNKLYLFSPITTKKQFEEALAYVVRQAQELSEKLLGEGLQLSTAKIFAHYPEEYEFLKQIISDYGNVSSIGRSTSMYVDCSLDIDGSKLNHIGIRVPDPYRMQVGCGDYVITDPQKFAALASYDKQSYVRYFPDMPETFIELWHPDYDVTGYIPLN